MRRMVFAIGFFVVVLAGGMAQAPIQAPSAPPSAPPSLATGDLIEHAKEWDGRTIVFEGEAIGDAMRRGDHAWINVLDANAAMGVWMTAGQAAGVARLGSYRMTGDRLRIIGVFNRACAEHGGDMDIHALSVELLERGAARSHPVDRLGLWLLVPAFALAAALVLLWRRREASLRRQGL